MVWRTGFWFWLTFSMGFLPSMALVNPLISRQDFPDLTEFQELLEKGTNEIPPFPKVIKRELKIRLDHHISNEEAEATKAASAQADVATTSQATTQVLATMTQQMTALGQILAKLSEEPA